MQLFNGFVSGTKTHQQAHALHVLLKKIFGFAGLLLVSR